MSHVLDKGKNRNKQIWGTFLAFTEDLVSNVNLLKVTQIKQLTLYLRGSKLHYAETKQDTAAIFLGYCGYGSVRP